MVLMRAGEIITSGSFGRAEAQSNYFSDIRVKTNVTVKKIDNNIYHFAVPGHHSGTLEFEVIDNNKTLHIIGISKAFRNIDIMMAIPKNTKEIHQMCFHGTLIIEFIPQKSDYTIPVIQQSDADFIQLERKVREYLTIT